MSCDWCKSEKARPTILLMLEPAEDSKRAWHDARLRIHFHELEDFVKIKNRTTQDRYLGE